MKNLTCPQCGTEVRDLTRENVEFEIRVVKRMIETFKAGSNDPTNEDFEKHGYDNLVKAYKYVLEHLENTLK